MTIRDDILAKYTQPIPAAAPGPPAVDPTASALTQMWQGGFSQPPTREDIAAKYTTDPREAVGAGFGNAFGLVGSEDPRYQVLNQVHPNYVTGGKVLGYGADAMTAVAGAPAAGAAAGAAAKTAVEMAPELGQRALGLGLRWGATPYYALHTFEPTGTAALWGTGNWLRKAANARRAARLGNTTLYEELAAQEAPQTDEAMSALGQVLKAMFGRR